MYVVRHVLYISRIAPVVIELGQLENTQDIPGTVWNVVLEKDGKYELDR
jgi:hypothetical protein